MPSNYMTPGVYVEEITKFPPSVVAVPTAIPAFIGYTEKAEKKIAGDLLNKPTKITAIAEYARYFGGPQPEENFTTNIVDSIDEASGRLIRTVTVKEPINKSPFQMNYAIQMYFANGGGPCYIISVDTYPQGNGDPNTVKVDRLGTNSTGNGGLDLLEKEDEPTLIVFPDAQALDEGDYFTLYQAALKQCNKLKDRFAVMDTRGDNISATTVFRDRIGTQFLKYGAVYFPFIETSINYKYNETDVSIEHESLTLPQSAITNIQSQPDNITAANKNITDINVTTPADTVIAANNKPAKITALPALQLASNSVIIELEAANTALGIILTNANNVLDAYNDPDVTTAITNIGANLISDIISKLKGQVTSAQSVIDNNSALTGPKIDELAIDAKTTVGGIDTVLINLVTILIPALLVAIEGNNPDTLISSVNTSVDNIRNAVQSIEDLDEEDAAALAGNIATVIAQISVIKLELANVSAATGNITETKIIESNFADLSVFNTNIDKALLFFNGGPNADDFKSEYANLMTTLEELMLRLANTQNGVKYLSLGSLNLAEIKDIDNESYNTIKQEIEAIGVKLPPSSSIAGIYAQVDRDRGVWKAPANVSLSAVIEPTVKVTNDIQDGLNVDSVAGKSINVIRAFAGKGTLVWGGRTLAGNDNEWRYVSVRRFFNFAEESIKKATSQFVFEPNDANTWVRVKAMIENFLILQWRQGALAGAKTEHAFYVRVGLGVTMTPIDILEGRMIIEIGMAVVRPAEFIILRFSHKMQES